MMGDLIDRDALGVGPANPNVFKSSAYADGWNALLRMRRECCQKECCVAIPMVCQFRKMDIAIDGSERRTNDEPPRPLEIILA